ncbi:T9SS type A sorting domain-containing protein [Flavobacterium sp. Sd200]|uniref:endonuclease n=1 Tax=Flavobacterium sp. Sd200 TaxID=2692211 RepID=UPI00136DB4C6|nr:endonuclease [Flavobacterium sp. Sd200]MXN90106.1 T9SS type A sorting domain-containing protein [Flavobacterium sp. Sd200]
MNKIFTLVLGFIALGAYAQAPANYYNNATGTGYTLKTQLHNIIRGHNTQSYNQLYTCYEESDRDYFYENDGTVLDIYSENPTGADPYNFSATNRNDRCGNYANEGDCYNREHLLPQSVFNERSPMVSDAHHILPTDGKVNGYRGNLPFGRVNNTNYTSRNGSKRGSNLNSGYTAGFSGTVFEPIDEFKGDVARCLLYMAVRYQDVIAGWGDWAMLDGTNDHVFTNWALTTLLTWHQQDPVSDRETTRNNAVYDFQGNRNPFIDHPEYAAQIWGTVAGTEDIFASALSVYPNPAVNNKVNIYSEAVLDEIQLISINGQLVQRIQKPQAINSTYTLEQLPQGLYLLKATSGNQTVTKKIVVN